MYRVVESFMEHMEALRDQHNEVVYSYHVDMDASSRLCGCEMNIRVLSGKAVLTAVLPIAVRPKERYGIVCKLAEYNRSRLQKDQDGAFELDTLRGRIQFMLETCGLADEHQLGEKVNYCLSEVQRYSEAIMNLVCDESNAIYEEEREKIEYERKAAERAARTREYKNVPVMGKLMGLLGLIDEDDEEYSPICLEIPAPETLSEKKEAAPEEETEERTEEKSEEKAQETDA